MKLFQYHICWKYSSENFEFGIIQANSIEEAEATLKRANPNIIGCNVYEIFYDEYGICEIYSH